MGPWHLKEQAPRKWCVPSWKIGFSQLYFILLLIFLNQSKMSFPPEVSLGTEV